MTLSALSLKRIHNAPIPHMYAAECKCCHNLQAVPRTDKVSAERMLRALGWRGQRATGWTCPQCRQMEGPQSSGSESFAPPASDPDVLWCEFCRDFQEFVYRGSSERDVRRGPHAETVHHWQCLNCYRERVRNDGAS